MNRPVHATFSALLLLLPLAAQTQTSPAGLLTSEGTYWGNAFGSKSGTSGMNTFLRQLDGTLVGTGARSITTLHLRRDGTSPTNTTATARTLPVWVRLAHGDYAKVRNVTQQPDTDWLAGAWSVLATGKTVALPDLRSQPGTTPAPWAITIPLDAPFTFSGTKALAIDFKLGGSSLPSDQEYQLDAEFGLSYSYASGTIVGTSCKPIGSSVAALHTTVVQHYGDATINGFARFWLSSGPANSAAWLLLGASNPALELGLCAKLVSSAEIVVPMPTTTAAGATSVACDFVFQPQLSGSSLYSQIVAANPGQPSLPVLLSNGALTRLPAPPVFTVACASTVLWTGTSEWLTASSWHKNGGNVFGF